MRIRVATRVGVLAVLLAVLSALSGCSNEAGPAPKHAPRDPGPEALRTKLAALTVDDCYRAPEAQDPAGCAKYVTQLGSIPGRAEKYAGDAHPELAEHGRALAAGIESYRRARCDQPDTAGQPACAQALTDIAAALGAVQDALVTMLDGPAASR
ncbi:hypothetical protein SAMN05421810_105126 [Amycolatopsis arida]|uniref:Uncharacterized protein n=1 Tax=Amycolatopsis arida TaxID=587909 RepID=A0A1I5WIH6_9PSEU|nr:hypothetical protein [Amycolatopsis arida]TDX92300.1 hypothetical protein CLV69_105145 [Amycolatopsis arida]SFQ19479.1 hypothetical protein SAMN05421810_105126 [Amycolatopsis arida]